MNDQTHKSRTAHAVAFRFGFSSNFSWWHIFPRIWNATVARTHREFNTNPLGWGKAFQFNSFINSFMPFQSEFLSRLARDAHKNCLYRATHYEQCHSMDISSVQYNVRLFSSLPRRLCDLNGKRNLVVPQMQWLCLSVYIWLLFLFFCCCCRWCYEPYIVFMWLRCWRRVKCNAPISKCWTNLHKFDSQHTEHFRCIHEAYYIYLNGQCYWFTCTLLLARMK